jgi:hypothetical protein
VSVRRDVHPVVAGGLDDCGQLLVGEKRRLSALGQAQHAAAGGYLDEVRAVLVALPDAGAHLVWPIGRPRQDGRKRLLELRRKAVGAVSVAAGCGHRPGRDDAWALDPSKTLLAGFTTVRDCGAGNSLWRSHRGARRSA